MNSKILLLALTVALFSSCSTSYKTGQTPDDVYYSPVKPEEDYVQASTSNDQSKYSGQDDEYYEDQYLRMKVRNRYRWSDLEDPYYTNYRYNATSYNCCCLGNPWTPSVYWNSHYNPYYNYYSIVSPKAVATYYKPRIFNLNTYNNTATINGNYSSPRSGTSGTTTSPASNTNTSPQPRNSNNKGGTGNALRQVFRQSNESSSSGSSHTGTNNSSNSNNTNNSSSNNNNSSSSSGSSSSSSSGSGSSAPVRKF